MLFWCWVVLLYLLVGLVVAALLCRVKVVDPPESSPFAFAATVVLWPLALLLTAFHTLVE